MSKRIDFVVKDVTDYILSEAQKEVERKLGLRTTAPLLNQFAFICKDAASAKIMVNYLVNEFGFIVKSRPDKTWVLCSEHDEKARVWTYNQLDSMRGYKYQIVFIQDCIYEKISDNAILNVVYIGDMMSLIEPQMFRLPNPMESVKTTLLPTKTVFND